MPSGRRSSEPVSYPIGGHKQMVVSVNLWRMDPGRAREAGIALGWRLRQAEQIDGPIATRSRTSRAQNSHGPSIIPATRGRFQTSVRARRVKRPPSMSRTEPGRGTALSGICFVGQPRRICRASDRGPS
jgi:hypothetical protein